MFTGIVQALRPVIEIIQQPGRLHYAVDLGQELTENLQTGSSISIDGVCQTVTRVDGHLVWFDAIEETLNKTTLKKLSHGQLVNIERAARVGDEISGHILSGHIYGTATITDIQKPQNNYIVTLQCPEDWIRYLFEKGFIALDGASLTVVDVSLEGQFIVHLIPETLQRTIFGTKKIGDLVNLEFDAQTQAVVETVERVMQRNQKKLYK
jgi:riboflavin synthase